MRRRSAFPSALALAVALGACAYVPLPPLGGGLTTQNLDPDEQSLWKKSRELQHEIESSGLLFEDRELDAYLARVLRRVTPDELTAAGVEPRVQVISDVHMHAYSFANGVIYVHTALLARLLDETQLATVLTRELAHVVHRHSLRAHRDKRAQADTLAWVGVGATLVEGGGNAKLLAQAASITSMAGFHHLLETEADAKGLASLHAAGYDVRATPDFFQMTVDYQAELHAQGPWAWAAFTPPPHMVARISGYETLIAQQYANAGAERAPIADPKTFRGKLQGATRRQAELELAAGLFASAEQTARLATEARPDDPDAWILLGQALQGQRGKAAPGKKVPPIHEVREAFGEALRVDRRNPEATRELGMSFYRKSAPERTPEASEQALHYLRRYLALAPAAEDADYVRGYVRELEGERR